MHVKAWMFAAVGAFVAQGALAQDTYEQKPEGKAQDKSAQKAEPQKAGERGQMAPKAGIQDTLDVVGVSGNKLALEKNGLIVDVKVDHATAINGQETKRMERVESRLKSEFHPGDKVKVSGKVAKHDNYAQSIEMIQKSAMTPTQEQDRARAAERTGEPKKISGKVVGVDGSNLLIDVDGFVVKLKTDRDTMLNGATVPMDKRIESRLKQDFTPGQEIQAEVMRDKLENKAVSINKGGSMGSMGDGEKSGNVPR